MRRLGRPAGVVLATCGVLAAAALGAVAVRVQATLHPPRTVESAGSLQRQVVRAEEVGIVSTDGTSLAGWVLDGVGSQPWVVVCHDLGSNKGELLNLGLAIQEAGFHVLLFDFRGHGESGGSGSGLGVREKGDVLGALDWVRERSGGSPVGVVGVGMGAHAAVLAAAERSEVRVLVLDGLYPDGASPLLEAVFGDWEFGARRLGFVARAMYAAFTRTDVRRERAEDALALLAERHVLLLAPAGDRRTEERLERMVARIPEGRRAEGNLATLPATGSGRLYGEDSKRYRDRVVGFLRERLPTP